MRVLNIVFSGILLLLCKTTYSQSMWFKDVIHNFEDSVLASPCLDRSLVYYPARMLSVEDGSFQGTVTDEYFVKKYFSEIFPIDDLESTFGFYGRATLLGTYGQNDNEDVEILYFLVTFGYVRQTIVQMVLRDDYVRSINCMSDFDYSSDGLPITLRVAKVSPFQPLDFDLCLKVWYSDMQRPDTFHVCESFFIDSLGYIQENKLSKFGE